MKASVEKKFDRLDQKLERLIAQLREYSEEQLNQQPGEGAWSALQIMHHLLLAENYAYLYLKKKLSYNPDLPKAGFGNFYRNLLLRFYLASPFKFKAPGPVTGEALPAVSSVSEVENLWKTNRKNLRAFMASFPEAHYQKSIYKHPFAGKLTLGGMINFFEYHFDRHHKQINRTLAVVSD